MSEPSDLERAIELERLVSAIAQRHPQPFWMSWTDINLLRYAAFRLRTLQNSE